MGWSSEIKKIQSSRGYQILKNNISVSSYIYIVYYHTHMVQFNIMNWLSTSENRIILLVLQNKYLLDFVCASSCSTSTEDNLVDAEAINEFIQLFFFLFTSDIEQLLSLFQENGKVLDPPLLLLVDHHLQLNRAALPRV